MKRRRSLKKKNEKKKEKRTLNGFDAKNERVHSCNLNVLGIRFFKGPS